MGVTQRKKHDWNTKIFVAVFLLGALLRFFALFSHDFWFDEAFTYEVSKLSIQKLVLTTLSDNNPPFYYLIIHFLLKINQSEIWLRLPSLLANLATIPLIYILGKNYLNTKTAKVAATLFALSPLAVYLSAEARLHSVAVLILTAMVLSFFNMAKKINSKTIIIFLIISILGLYTQYYLILLEIAFLLLAIHGEKPQRAKTALIVILPLILLLPWILLSKNVTQNICWCPNTLLSLPSSIVSPSVSGVGMVTLRSFIHLPTQYLILFLTSAATCTLFFLKGLFKNKVLTTSYIFPLIFLTIAGLFLPVFSPKAFSIFIPLFFLITAQGLSKAPRLVVPCLILLLGTTSIVQITSQFFAGEQIKAAYKLTLNAPNAPIYHTSLVTYYSFDFYSKGQQKNILITPNHLSLSTILYIGGKNQQVEDEAENSWLVDIDKWTTPSDRVKAQKEVFSKYTISQTNNKNEITIYYLQKK